MVDSALSSIGAVSVSPTPSVVEGWGMIFSVEEVSVSSAISDSDSLRLRRRGLRNSDASALSGSG
jgi:hypothetical protein